MGGGASVSAASRTLLESRQAQAAALASLRVLQLTAARLVQATRRAEQLRAVANERAERLVLVRVRRAAAHAEAVSKRWFVHRVSTTSAVIAFAFDLRECVLYQEEEEEEESDGTRADTRIACA